MGVQGREVRGELLPLLRAEAQPGHGDADALTRRLNAACRLAAHSLLTWRAHERAFLDRLLDVGEIAPDLLTQVAVMQGRIAAQPMLRWKAMHVRQHRGLPALEPEEA